MKMARGLELQNSLEERADAEGAAWCAAGVAGVAMGSMNQRDGNGGVLSGGWWQPGLKHRR